MSKTYINGKLVNSSTNYAAAIEYTDKDNNKTTVQDGLDNLTENMGGLSFGIDANGNYGYFKVGADTVTPFLKSDFIDIDKINNLNLETKTLSDGSKWLKVFYHDCSTGTWFSTVDTINFVNDTYRYNLMNCLEMFKRHESSKYEFLLEYPELGDNYTNRWSQTSNPTTTYNAVSGYTAISIKVSKNFKGMALTDSTTTASTWMDGQVGNSTWWFALGAKKVYQNNGFPGPDSTIVKKVKLWMRIPN